MEVIDYILNLKAGKLKIPFTTGLLLGIGESFKDRIKDLLLIKRIHEKFGHIQEVILQKFEPKEGITYKPKNDLSIKEYLKITAIARIIFRNEIPIQVPPNLITGFEKEFIEMGVNDFVMGLIDPQRRVFTFIITQLDEFIAASMGHFEIHVVLPRDVSPE